MWIIDLIQSICEAIGDHVPTPYEEFFNQALQAIAQILQGTAP